MFRPRRNHGMGSRGGGLAVFLLLFQMFQVGFDRIPPTTLVTILGQVAVHLRLFDVPFPAINDVCISAINVWYREDWTRLFMAAFFHANDWHLYYNMVSFLWKGLTIERRLGSGYFAYLIGVFALLTNVLTIGLSILAENWFHDASYLSQCAVGFSGVLFALKVITTHMLPPGMHYIMGVFPVPSRYAVWAELGVIQLLVPNASFIGHLAGILVGLAYVKGPLQSLMDIVVPSEPSYTYQAQASGYRPRFWGGGASTAAGPRDRTDGRYDRYTGGLSEQEQLAQALRRSREQNGEDDAQLARAVHESLMQTNARTTESRRPEPSAPPDPEPSAPPDDHREDTPTNQSSSATRTNRLYPDLSSRAVDQEEIRRRRLARFK